MRETFFVARKRLFNHGVPGAAEPQPMRKTLANWESTLTAECTENTEGMGEVALGKSSLVVLRWLSALRGPSGPWPIPPD